MADCLFCNIRDGKIPSVTVYEDAYVFAFLDSNPVNPGHTLVAPKIHCRRMSETDNAMLAQLVAAAKKLGDAVCAAMGASAYNFMTNNGADAGQVVMHLHFHLIPRFSGDGHRMRKGTPYAEGEMEKIGKMIKKTVGV